MIEELERLMSEANPGPFRLRRSAPPILTRACLRRPHPQRSIDV
jgi:hypothetical protein